MCCFCQVVFWAALRYGWHLHIQSERWRSLKEAEDTMMEGRLRGVPVNGRDWVWFVLQRVECKSLPGLKQTFGSGVFCFRNTTILELNHFVSQINRRETLTLNHWHSLSFLLPCCPSALFYYPANRKQILKQWHVTDVCLRSSALLIRNLQPVVKEKNKMFCFRKSNRDSLFMQKV